MPGELLKKQISDWLINQSLWLKYAGKEILYGNGYDAKLGVIYDIFLHENGLKAWEGELPKVDFPEVEIQSGAGTSPLKLLKLKEVKNANALALGQEINFGPQLTVIYGGNGAGKSGYIRLCNNAFVSRGDKEILKNVFNPQKEPASCVFTFQASGTPFDLKYPENKGNSEFLKFGVFDSKSIKMHLEAENMLNFTPSGFEFFEKVIELYGKLSALLSKEIKSAQRPNDFIGMFSSNNQVQSFIAGLNHSTKEDELKDLANFGEIENGRLDELYKRKDALKALNVAEKLRQLQSQRQIVETIQHNFKNHLALFTTQQIEDLTKLIQAQNDLQSLVVKQGIESLKDYNIPNVGSKEWRDFIVAANAYANQLAGTRGSSYPQEKDKCVFCLQELDKSHLELVNSYWSLLKSEGEKELLRINANISQAHRKIASLPVLSFDETTPGFDVIKEHNGKMAEKWKNILAACISNKDNAQKNLLNKKMEFPIEAISESPAEFDAVLSSLARQMEELVKQDTQLQLKKIEEEIQFLSDKKTLSSLQDKILAFINSHKWSKRAEMAASAFRTNSITAKQGELFAQHVTAKYLETFKEECENFKAPSFVAINQRNAKASTLRQLKVENSFANKVLSEGEQRAISLADFITELRLNPNNTGMIFDDPTTSLDHQRRALIAKRLVELSKEKQIAVFTHDMVFLLNLTQLAEEAGIATVLQSMHRAGDNSGFINNGLPWFAQTVGKRVGYLRDRLNNKFKKAEKAGGDEHLTEAKAWYGLLREGWERAVEEKLLYGVVERYSPGIQTQRLRKMPFSQALVDKVEKGMTESSAWVHDTAAGMQPNIPTFSDAEAALKELDEFVAACVPLKG